ncbi:MAG TPA: anti-sigma factor [Gaiellaceae bacterium]|nr:anti-sigma factor [Gaiellaceae bacterium]
MDVARLSANELERNGPALHLPGAADPPESLRVTQPVGLPREPRPAGTTLAVLAVLAGVAAIALGSWAFASGGRSDRSSEAVPVASTAATERAIALLSKPSTERIPVEGSGGRMILVAGPGGRSFLALDGLEPASAGETYQAWLIGPNGRVVASAAVFSGTEAIVPLSRIVARGSGIGVTLERTGGVPAPTRTLTLVALRTG